MSAPASEPIDPRRMRASDEDRERVARVLNDALEQGRLTPAEVHERITTLYASKTLGELEPLTEDLPNHASLVLPPPASPVHHTPAATGAAMSRIGGTATSSVAIGILSGATRNGVWTVPAQFTAAAFMGGIDIDLTQARFVEHQTTITCVAIWGGIDIVVPDDIAVVVNGVGIMGAFEDSARVEGRPGAPIVKINGVAIMGGVEVKRAKQPKQKKQIDG